VACQGRPPGQLQAPSLTFLDLHHAGYIIACCGYLADVAVFFLAPGTSVELSTFTFVGELALMLWLLVRGVNVQRWDQAAALQPA